ncbi:MAG TPA: hypothetical protein VHM65_00050 [Candidatus Lustribacter sp.]|nr:hypothetical protein [Candidatus Lustribacter sp.]
MTFHDLPRGWDDGPVTDPSLVADVLDLFVSEQARATGALCLLLCDEADRLLQPCTVGDLPHDLSVDERRLALRPFAQALGGSPRRGGILVAVGRDGADLVTASDIAWREAAESELREWDVRLLGVYVVTPNRCMPVPAPDGYAVAAAG